MEDPSAFLAKAEKNLNDALRHFEAAPKGLAREFVDLKLQACIFQYDICAEMASIIRNRPSGFAESVALKGLVLRLFEYDFALHKHIVPRLLSLAKEREIVIDARTIRDLKQQWRGELHQLQGWAAVRNKAAGHYEKDLATQVSLLKTLQIDGVMTVAMAFLSFNMALLKLLRDAGRASA